MPCLRHTLVAAACAGLLVGCVTQASSFSRLDSSGLTVITLGDAVVFARPVPTIAAAARDYAYVGPIQVNRMGDRRNYLWIALASTVDRALAGVDPTHAVALVLVVDDIPMELQLAEWDTTLDGPPYSSTVPIYSTLAAHTSLDQIHQIAKAQAVELHLVVSSGNTARYQHWQGDWTAFAEFAGDD